MKEAWVIVTDNAIWYAWCNAGISILQEIKCDDNDNEKWNKTKPESKFTKTNERNGA